MGEDVAATVFSREDRQRYREKVKRCLDVFARMLSEARFEAAPGSIGLEIELNLTDEAGDPALLNARVLEAIADADFQTELAQFNVEINVAPRSLSGDVFCELERDVRTSLNNAEEKARSVGAHMVMVGILPTVIDRHLNSDSFSANPRYQLLNEQIFAARGEDLDITITGVERLVDVRRHDRARGRVHERAAPPPGRPRRVRHGLERGAGDRRRAGRARPPTRRGSSARSCGGRRGSRCSSRRRTRARRSCAPRASARACGSASAGSRRSSTCSRRTSATSPRCCRCSEEEDPVEVLARGDIPRLRRAAPAQRDDLPLEPADVRRRPRPAAPAGREPRAARGPDGRRRHRQRRLLLRPDPRARRPGPADLVADVVPGRDGQLPRGRARRDRGERVLARCRRGPGRRARAAAAAAARPRGARALGRRGRRPRPAAGDHRAALPEPAQRRRRGRRRRSTGCTRASGSTAATRCAR